MSFIVSAAQLNRILKEDGNLALFPSYTKDGVPFYVHACDGDPAARIHVGDIPVFHDTPNLFIGSQIHKIDSVGPVDFFPSYAYLSVQDMIAGGMDRLYKSLLKAIRRPVVTSSEKSPRVQFLAAEVHDEKDAKADANFLLMLKHEDLTAFRNLCTQPNMNRDNLDAIMGATELTVEKLFELLRSKWQMQ